MMRGTIHGEREGVKATASGGGEPAQDQGQGVGITRRSIGSDVRTIVRRGARASPGGAVGAAPAVRRGSPTALEAVPEAINVGLDRQFERLDHRGNEVTVETREPRADDIVTMPIHGAPVMPDGSTPPPLGQRHNRRDRYGARDDPPPGAWPCGTSDGLPTTAHAARNGPHRGRERAPPGQLIALGLADVNVLERRPSTGARPYPVQGAGRLGTLERDHRRGVVRRYTPAVRRRGSDRGIGVRQSSDAGGPDRCPRAGPSARQAASVCARCVGSRFGRASTCRCTTSASRVRPASPEQMPDPEHRLWVVGIAAEGRPSSCSARLESRCNQARTAAR